MEKIMSRKTYRAVAKIMNERLNHVRENTIYTHAERQIRIAELMTLMDQFTAYFQIDNDHFNRQVFEKEVTKFPEQ